MVRNGIPGNAERRVSLVTRPEFGVNGTACDIESYCF
jgi:hypothetical protein